MVDRTTDILIIGGGLVGSTLLLALANKGYELLLADAHDLSLDGTPHFDARSLALAPASQAIFKSLGLWEDLEPMATTINQIQVTEQGQFGAASLESSSGAALGYVLELQALNKALMPSLHSQNLLTGATLVRLDQQTSSATFQTSRGEKTIKARLIIAADGTESTVRRLSNQAVKKKDYAKHAIVANIGLARPHQGIAHERFTTAGPLALLPMNDNRLSLVWSLPPAEAARLTQLSETGFLTALQQAFGYRLGRFVQVGQRVIYPLQQALMPKQIAWPLVFVGNAAHSLHPVAGQGFNLGLRDVATLAQCIMEKGLNASMLHHYQSLRHNDQQMIINLTNNLINLFSTMFPGMRVARNLGLLAFDNIPLLKKSLIHYASGFAGIVPDLVCGLELHAKENP